MILTEKKKIFSMSKLWKSNFAARQVGAWHKQMVNTRDNAEVGLEKIWPE